MFKIVVSIVVLLVIAGGVWWSGWLNGIVPGLPTVQDVFGTKSATTTQQVPQQQNTQEPVNDLPTAANDASDQAISQDTAAIDAEIRAFAGDASSADNSLNDKPVTQEY